VHHHDSQDIFVTHLEKEQQKIPVQYRLLTGELTQKHPLLVGPAKQTCF